MPIFPSKFKFTTPPYEVLFIFGVNPSWFYLYKRWLVWMRRGVVYKIPLTSFLKMYHNNFVVREFSLFSFLCSTLLRVVFSLFVYVPSKKVSSTVSLFVPSEVRLVLYHIEWSKISYRECVSRTYHTLQ
jgi:hypothetical protein